MQIIKKAFQKVVKEIREDRNESIGRNSSYPKPMMTRVQMEKHEATVNCGGEWGTAESTRAIADMVLSDKRFEEFIKASNADADLELNAFGTYQIRLKFKDVEQM